MTMPGDPTDPAPRGVRSSRASIVAGVVAVMLVAAGGAYGGVRAARHRTGVARPARSAPPTRALSPAVAGVKPVTGVLRPWLVTPQTGYAIVGRNILQTSDGGRTWWDVYIADHLITVKWSAHSPETIAFAEIQGFAQERSEVEVAVGVTVVSLASCRTGTTMCAAATHTILLPYVPSIDTALSFPDRTHGWALFRLTDSDSVVRTLVYDTTDGGTTWNAVPVPIRSEAGSGSAAVRFVDDREGYLSGNKGEIVKTGDGGRTWSALRLQCPQPGCTSIEPDLNGLDAANDVLPATCTCGKSTSLWVYSLSTNDASLTARAALPGKWLAAADHSTWFALQGESDTTHLAVSHDGGVTWQRAPVRDTGSPYWSWMSFADASNGWSLRGLNTASLYATSDGGDTWTRVPVLGPA